jgi:stage IV sporulation protein A
MTSEPKFVPEEAAQICPDGKVTLRVRMIDSVGYMIPGAVGADEDGSPRMVTTPWFDHEIPMTEAAELGTKKVMEDHCTIGLVVTTDGSVTDIDRKDYLEAEGKAIRDMQKTGKPFLVLINSKQPQSWQAQQIKEQLRQEYGLEATVCDCQSLTEEDIGMLLQQLLMQFPMQQLRLFLPGWMNVLEAEHPVKKALYTALLQMAQDITTLSQAEQVLAGLKNLDFVSDHQVKAIDPAAGIVDCRLVFPEGLFYEILSSKTGMDITSDGQLLHILTDLSRIKADYDKISDALNAVRATGYGIVMPDAEDMTLEQPELLRKNGTFGVKLKAGAPSIHMIRIDIDTEIQPMVGSEQQSKDLMEFLAGEDSEKLWQSNIFGKSVYELIQEGLSAKVVRLPEDVRGKFRGTLSKIVNEGATGLICLIL